jgi:hypothetical protein
MAKKNITLSDKEINDTLEYAERIIRGEYSDYPEPLSLEELIKKKEELHKEYKEVCKKIIDKLCTKFQLECYKAIEEDKEGPTINWK